MPISRLIPILVLAAAGIALAGGTGRAPAGPACLSGGQWFTPAGERTASIPQPRLFADLGGKRIVLLGENHDDADHHRWQLQVITALHARQPNLVIGMEMLPRRAQPVLEAWVAGSLSESELLKQTDWARVWGFDPGMYLPILHFARVNRIPVIGVNVDRRLISEIGAKGLASLPAAGREGVSTPAAAKAHYRETLAQVFNDHGPKASDPAALARFIEAQIFWDRAFAEGLAAAAQRPGAPLVVGIMGLGHLSGEGVPHQLADLGFADTPVLLPVDANTPCNELPSGMAQAVFALPPARAESAAPRPRLGVTLEPAVDGVRVAEVAAGSVADQAGLKAGDLVRTIASRPVKESRDVTEAVARQAPGTWLPLTVARGGGQIDLVAKFPPTP